MEDKNNDKFYGTIIEIDETIIGGKPRKDNKKDDDNKGAGLKRGRGTKKTPVVVVIDRKERKVFLKVALANRKVQKFTGKQLIDILNSVFKGIFITVSSE